MASEYHVLLHWLYVGVMAAGAITFVIMRANPRGVPGYEYLIAIIIPTWSGLAYMSMALGQGMTEVGGQITFYARYLDWVVTTPLLLLALSLTAMFYVPKNFTIIATIMITDVIMILTGLIADFSLGINRFIWYSIGMAALVIILYIIWSPLYRIAKSQGRRLRQVYVRVAAYLSALWVGYPLTWLIGPSGLGMVGQNVDTFLFIVLPIFSKVGFSILDLTSLRSLYDKQREKIILKEKHA